MSIIQSEAAVTYMLIYRNIVIEVLLKQWLYVDDFTFSKHI